MSVTPFDMWEGFVVLGMVCVLMVVVVVLSHFKKLGLGKEFTVGMVMGSLQLFGIALVLTWLFAFPLWYFPIWILMGAMVLVGGYTSAKRAADMPRAWEITTPSIAISAVVVMAVLAVSGAMPMKPQYIIPLGGMVFGNSMRICSLSLERLMREVRVNKAALETTLSLGANSKQALEPYGKMSVRAALIPTIDNLKTLGIIFIPGAMAGLLIAGADPIVAAQYQIIIFLMLVGGGVISALTVAWLAERKLFNDSEQVQDWV